VEFLRPLKSSPSLEQAHALLRAEVASMPTDRYIAPDIEKAMGLVVGGALSSVFRTLAGLPALWIPA
jgi:histidine ammonia-lyase